MGFSGVLILGEAEKLALTGYNGLRALLLGENLDGEACDGCHKTHCVARGALGGRDEDGSYLLFRDAAEAGVENSGKLLHHMLIHREGEVHKAVFNSVGAEEKDDYKGVGVHIYKVKALYGGALSCREGKGGIVGHIRRYLTNIAHHLVQLLHLKLHTAVYFLRLLNAEAVAVHQLVDIHSVALSGGDAACGGVRLLKIAHTGEVGQLVADGGGAYVQAALLGDKLAAHGLGGGDIFINNGGQYALFSLAYFHSCSLSSKYFGSLDL